MRSMGESISLRAVLLVAAFGLTVSCGSSDVELSSDAGDTSGDDDGGGTGTGDGTGDGVSGCTEDGPACDNCVDDDEDGYIDGLDPECTGPADDREDSFATGISGDNIDDVFQDCFFDGNSGHEDDGCKRPTCCLLDADDPDCPPTPAASCESSQMCIETCAPYTPPGCDCWGCCTVCNDEGCYDIATGLASEDCNGDELSDEELCPRCVKNSECGSDCGTDPCTLCPGETELPPECEEQTCPDDQVLCGDGGTCADGYFCSGGCCVKEFVVD